MPSLAQRAAARSRIYQTLAEALAEPHADLVAMMLDACAQGASALGSAACRRTLDDLANLLPLSLAAIVQQYQTTMVPPDRRPPALYESLARHGRLTSAATQAVVGWYEPLGVTPATGELPDHAAVELAFLSALTAAESDADGSTLRQARLRQARKRFVQEHPGAWLPQLGAGLIAGGTPFYTLIGRWLRDFMLEERNGRPCRRTGLRLSPRLIRPADCTLCGLCTGVCPTGALRMTEDAAQTTLQLIPADCSGCGRCMTVCPETVLIMQEHECEGIETPPRTLRSSARQVCPQCGAPTVSHAEMAGVLARLQADDALVARLSLCVRCKALPL